MKGVFWTFLIVFALVSLLSRAFADGILIPVPEPTHSVRRIEPFSIKHHNVTVEIENQVAEVEIDQTFYNPNNVQLEAQYIFPLPEQVAVNDMSLFIDGEEIKGELLDKEKAQKIYEDIVRKMKDPALLEYMGMRTYKLRVFPMPPKGERRMKITYSHPIKRENNLMTFLYPLNTEKFSSRPLDHVSIDVHLKADQPLKNVSTPTHIVDIERENDKEWRIKYEDENVKPAHDFILHYSYSTDDIGMSLLTYREEGEDGFFMLFASPNSTVPEGDFVEKDVIFAIDTSGSMAGEKIDQARKSLIYCLNSLRPEDRFGIIKFSSEVTPIQESLIEANEENVRSTLAKVEAITARGGTNINEALSTALDMVDARSERPCYIVFLTDGLPTVGETTDTVEIARRVKEKNGGKARIFAFGVGYDVDSIFLNQLAQENRGAADYVPPKQDIEVIVSNFWDKINYPVLSDPSLSIEGVRTSEIYPKVIPDVFVGQQIIIYGRYSNAGPSDITLSGLVKGKKRYFSFGPRFAEVDTRYDFIPGFWANIKIGYLLDQIRIHGESEELKGEIIRLSKEYGIITPYTSWLVVDDKDSRLGRPLQEKIARIAPRMLEPMSVRKGAAGVKTSSRLIAQQSMAQNIAAEREMRRQDDIELFNAVQQNVMRVGNKTFYRNGDQWVDIDYEEGKQKVVDVEFLSDDYFKILEKHPELGRFFAQGRNVQVVYGDVAYRIVAP